MMAGDFTTIASAACPGGPRTLPAQFGSVNNRISPSLFSAPAVAVQKLLPPASDPCGKVYYAKINRNNEYLVPARIDYQVNEKHSLFGRFNLSRLDQASQFDGKNILTLDAGASPLRVYEFVLGHTYLIGPGTVASFRGSVNRSNIVKQPPDFQDPFIMRWLRYCEKKRVPRSHELVTSKPAIVGERLCFRRSPSTPAALPVRTPAPMPSLHRPATTAQGYSTTTT